MQVRLISWPRRLKSVPADTGQSIGIFRGDHLGQEWRWGKGFTQRMNRTGRTDHLIPCRRLETAFSLPDLQNLWVGQECIPVLPWPCWTRCGSHRPLGLRQSQLNSFTNQRIAKITRAGLALLTRFRFFRRQLCFGEAVEQFCQFRFQLGFVKQMNLVTQFSLLAANFAASSNAQSLRVWGYSDPVRGYLHPCAWWSAWWLVKLSDRLIQHLNLRILLRQKLLKTPDKRSQLGDWKGFGIEVWQGGFRLWNHWLMIPHSPHSQHAFRLGQPSHNAEFCVAASGWDRSHPATSWSARRWAKSGLPSPWPPEFFLCQRLVVKHETIVFPHQALDTILVPVGKGIQRPTEGIMPQLEFDQCRQTVGLFAKVDGRPIEINIRQRRGRTQIPGTHHSCLRMSPSKSTLWACSPVMTIPLGSVRVSSSEGATMAGSTRAKSERTWVKLVWDTSWSSLRRQ